VTDGISRQAKITYSPRSEDLLATNDNVTCICPRSYHCGNKQSQHDRAMHSCITLRTFRTKTTCTRDKNSIYKERGSEPPLSVSSCMSALPPARRRQYRSPPSVSKAHDFLTRDLGSRTPTRRPTVAAGDMGTAVVSDLRLRRPGRRCKARSIVSPRR
jgi:hypothetical protein